jgi:hypothetical protein
MALLSLFGGESVAPVRATEPKTSAGKEPRAGDAARPVDPEHAAKIAEIAAWIDLGAAYDQPLIEKKAKVANWTEKVVAPESKQFWSFQRQ